MHVYGQLIKAQLENTTSDPAKRGEIVFKTDSVKAKFHDGVAARSIVSEDATQTLTNKTLTLPIISSISNTGTLTLPTSTDTLVGRDTTDTLTNKTLTAPVIATISNTGTLTLPTSTDTLVGKATTDILTNKTLTSPIMTAPNVSNFILLDEQGSAPATPAAGKKAIYAKTDGLVYTKDDAGSETPIGSGGGGGNLVISEIANSPVRSFLANMPVYSFGAGLDQSLYVTVNIPSSYVAGKPVKLKIKAFNEDTSGTILISALAVLVRAEVDDYDSTTNTHSSTNSAITMSAANDKEMQKITLDLSSATGTVNSEAIAAGDVLIVRIYRNTDTATGDVQYVMGSEELTLT
jgi:hypothetical protein